MIVGTLLPSDQDGGFFQGDLNLHASIISEIAQEIHEKYGFVSCQPYLTNGGSIELVARSKSSGRGFTVDTLVCDEAQEPTDDELQAINPSISAAPSGDPLGDIAHILGELLKDPIGYPNARLGVRLPLGAQRGARADPRGPLVRPGVFGAPGGGAVQAVVTIASRPASWRRASAWRRP